MRRVVSSDSDEYDVDQYSAVCGRTPDNSTFFMLDIQYNPQKFTRFRGLWYNIMLNSVCAL